MHFLFVCYNECVEKNEMLNIKFEVDEDDLWLLSVLY